MEIEHFAINIKDAVEFAEWYAAHLGLNIIRSNRAAKPFESFMIDSKGHTILEVYSDPQAEFLDYAALNPYTFHIAFKVTDIEQVIEKLVAAGASYDGELLTNSTHDKVTFVRCPWGVALQFVERNEPLI
ncbi:MAG: VOC family protein [Anaerolineae bacterium]